MKEKIIVGMILILKTLAILAIPVYLGFYIYALVVYGNTPVIDMPVWVMWIMGK